MTEDKTRIDIEAAFKAKDFENPCPKCQWKDNCPADITGCDSHYVFKLREIYRGH